jgi:hypothetical protein
VTVPTLTSVTPAIALTAGGSLVTLAGSGFRVGAPASSPALGFTTWQPTVVVLFGGVPATEVRVQADGQLTCLAPPAPESLIPKPRSKDVAPLPVTITVLNVDDNGAPIAGEQATLSGAFSYTLPLFTAEYESDFTRSIRTLIQLMKRQLLPVEINYATQTDYDPTSGDELHVTKFARLPAIALVGPDLEENRFYSTNDEPTFDDGTTEPDGEPAGFIRTRVPYTVDVSWQVICVSNNKEELLNLMVGFVSFMHANKWLYMDRSATDPTKGQVRYELDFAPNGQPKNTTSPNTSNVVSWSANIRLRGFDIESFAGLTADGTVDPAGLIPAHAAVEHGQTAEQVSLTTADLSDEVDTTIVGA